MSPKNRNNRNKGKKAKGGNTPGPNSPQGSNDRQMGTGGQSSGGRQATPLIPSPPPEDIPVIARRVLNPTSKNLQDTLQETEHNQGRGTGANLGGNEQDNATTVRALSRLPRTCRSI